MARMLFMDIPFRSFPGRNGIYESLSPDIPIVTIGAQHFAFLRSIAAANHGQGNHILQFYVVNLHGGGYIIFFHRFFVFALELFSNHFTAFLAPFTT